MKKLIAVDVDGTLVNSEGEITPRTRHALIRATRAGHEVMIVSGRPTYGLRHEAKELGLTSLAGFYQPIMVVCSMILRKKKFSLIILWIINLPRKF